MANVQRVTYGKGGFDATRPTSNVVDTGVEVVDDPPAGVPAAVVALRNKLTGQGVQPTDTQLLNALSVLVGRLLVRQFIDG